MADILEFVGPHRSLSNMAAAQVCWGDALTPERIWPNSEVPYFLARTSNVETRQKIIDTSRDQYKALRGAQRSHADAVEITGKTIKKLWRQPGIGPGEADEDRKVLIMKALVFDKIGRNPDIAALALSTGKGLIQEGNHHGDTYWGVSMKDVPYRGVRAGEGKNMLGKIYMEGRDLVVAHGAPFLLKTAADLRAQLHAVPEQAAQRPAAKRPSRNLSLEL